MVLGKMRKQIITTLKLFDDDDDLTCYSDCDFDDETVDYSLMWNEYLVDFWYSEEFVFEVTLTYNV